MAQKTLIVLTDDLSGDEIAEGQGETVTFALDGTNYEIDLTDKNAVALRKAFGKYVEAARKVGRNNVRSIGSARGANAAARKDGSESRAIRAWAVEKGLMKADSRGRVPSAIKEQYAAAQG